MISLDDRWKASDNISMILLPSADDPKIAICKFGWLWYAFDGIPFDETKPPARFIASGRSLEDIEARINQQSPTVLLTVVP